MSIERISGLAFYSSFLFSVLLIVSCIFGYFGRNLVSFISSIIIPVLVIFNLIILVFWMFQKSQNIIVPLLALFIFGLLFNSFFQLNTAKEINDTDAFSILTYNTCGSRLKDEKKIDELVEFIEAKDPDIIVFQELWSFGFRRLKSYPFSFLGYRPNKSKSSQFMVSKFPILNQGYVDFPDSRNNAMFVDVDVHGEMVRIYNVHLQSYQVNVYNQHFSISNMFTLFKNIGRAQKKRDKQTVLLKASLKDFNGKTIICGDFNSTPFSKSYQMLAKNRLDTFVEKGNGLGTTFRLWDYPLRLDYILPDKSFEVLGHENFKLKLSDHEPVYAKIKLK